MEGRGWRGGVEGGREKGREEGERKGGCLMVIFLLASGLQTNCIYTKLVDEVYMNTCCFIGNMTFHAGALNVVQHILAMIVHAFCALYLLTAERPTVKSI